MQKILTSQEINQKLVRLAHQIIENAYDEPILHIGGINGNGFKLAVVLKDMLKNINGQEVIDFEITVNKDEPWKEEIGISIDEKELKNAYILLIDDVINSGKTMQYALIKFLQQPTKSIKTVSIIDRKHRRYPIKADYVGLTLSTTLREHIEVRAVSDGFEAYLL
ncbi:MAG: pyrimidine operon attenuation protein/uracil phosphoribosyltransferase [Lentimonas sp.]|jgi:pyrimidine operon attenuation protein/uracil phosphoribosyltransferase